jgi:transcriptional regulator with XRE-family HTH domain
MENPVLAFRKAKGWSRREFARRSGLNYQTLQNLEIGETKRITPQTKEYLSFVGIGEDIQERLSAWHQHLMENRRNGKFDYVEG